MAGQRRVRVLFLCPFIPWPLTDGGRTRVYHLMRAAAANHEVHLLALVDEREDPSAAQHLETDGIQVELVPYRRSLPRATVGALRRGHSVYRQMFASNRFASVLRGRLARDSYDIVQCEYAYMAQYFVARSGPAWVMDAHNVEFRLSQSIVATRSRWDVLYRSYAAREWRLRRREERQACRQMDRVLAVSEDDANLLRHEAPGARIHVIPNGVDTSRFAPADRRPAPSGDVVFVGDMSYRPNADGVLWFCREVWHRIRIQLPAARFRVIGRPSPEVTRLHGLPGVEVVGRVPEILPYLQAADVLLVPLRSGSGTRFKVLEALAVGAAVVSTSKGHEGIGVTPGKHLLSADSPESFAASTITLLKRPELRTTIGAAGRRLIEERYSWAGISRDVSAVYESLRAGRAGTP
jgi:sugar transferase (PEP-CTERM/EpsH1 system associated)